MSFSSETKQEITHIELDKKCCQLAEIAGFVRMCGSITLIGGKMGVRLTTDSPATARLFAKLLKSYFDTKADLNVEDTTPLKKGHAYQLIITPDMNADLILRETGILGVKEGSDVVVCSRVRLADGKPVVYTTDYLSNRISQAFIGSMDDNISIYDFIENECGIPIGTCRTQMIPAKADEYLADVLDVPVDALLMKFRLRLNDVFGEALVYAEEYFKPDVFDFVVLRTRK